MKYSKNRVKVLTVTLKAKYRVQGIRTIDGRVAGWDTSCNVARNSPCNTKHVYKWENDFKDMKTSISTIKMAISRLLKKFK